jgi:hypothetical protein
MRFREKGHKANGHEDAVSTFVFADAVTIREARVENIIVPPAPNSEPQHRYSR